MMASEKSDVAIIGAGISGLSLAHYLSRRGIGVRVLERRDTVGGTIATRRVRGYLIEAGPNSVLDTTPRLRDLAHDIGLDSEIRYAGRRAKKRYIVRDGRLHALPSGPASFLSTRLFSPRAKCRVLREPWIKPAPPEREETLAEFVCRRLGSELLDYAIDPFVSGVYAGMPERLSVRAGFPKLYALEQRYGGLIRGTVAGRRERKRRAGSSRQTAGIFSFSGGMQMLVDGLSRGQLANICTDVRIDAIRRVAGGYEIRGRAGEASMNLQARALVIAVPAHAYDKLAIDLPSSLRRLLAAIYYPPVSVVFTGYKRNPARIAIDGFGFLVPAKEKRKILGTLWNSALFDGRAPEGATAMTTFVGGARQPEYARLPDAELGVLVAGELRELMGVDERPDVLTIERWEKAIPQYDVGHGEVMEALEAFECESPGLYVTGNFRGGVAVGDCVAGAFELSERIATAIGSM